MFSAGIFILVGNPVKLLLMAGTVNGFALPVALGIILLAANNRKIVKEYKHPIWLQVVGWLVVTSMGVMSMMGLIKVVFN